MKIIQNYDQINIIEDTLIIFDVDETIIKYPSINKKWWNYHNNTFGSEYAYNLWLNIIYNNNPELLDSDKFFNFIKNVNELACCKIIYYTARPIEIKDITLKHLKSCNFDINENDIFYNKNTLMGIEILNIIKKYNYNNIIFVDDVIKHIDNVLNHTNGIYNIEPYLMEHENL